MTALDPAGGALESAELDSAELAAALIDPVRLGAWMDASGLPGAGSPVTYEMISGGNQNSIFSVRRGSYHGILRRPPRIVPAGRNKSMAREYRVLAALRGSDVPHPDVHALCTDHSVLGATFYLMDPVDGWSLLVNASWPPPYDSDLALRRDAAFALVGGIAALSNVDWRSRGLDGFGKPDNFHDRQVDRWYAFLEGARTREIPGLDEAGSWLRSHRPASWRPGIMHGDYHFPNVLFARDLPVRLAAIVDWEMATIGDPMLDLSQILMNWPDPGEDPKAGMFDLTGMPSRAELVAHYERVSGRPVRDLDYYLILNRFKMAIVLERGYYRYLQGETDNPKAAMYGDLVLDAAAKAGELAARV
ncbi:MAG TPA: phosphotransferase family protein [Trebonia sp.]